MSDTEDMTDDEYAFHERETLETVNFAARGYYKAQLEGVFDDATLARRVSWMALPAIMLTRLPRTKMTDVGLSPDALSLGAQRAIRRSVLELVERPSETLDAFWLKASVLGSLEAALAEDSHCLAMLETALWKDAERLGISTADPDL